MDIGPTILRVRKEKGIKQKDLARGAGISPTYLSQIEKGQRIPRIDILEKISAEINVPLSILSFLSLDIDSIPEDKKYAYNQVKPLLDGLVEKIFFD
ncbi:MAG TPA: helix-turn-helix transcriptional regulator [Ignavibacteria bacterium]